MDTDFQKRIITIFDYTYSNTSIRIPSQVGIEVGKILHTGLYREEKQKIPTAFEFTNSVVKSIQNGSRSDVEQTAKTVRDSYYLMNKDLSLYEGDIRFENNQLAYIVSLLNGINFSNKERDYFGDALEIFRSTWAKQAGGQFFTDQRVTSLAIRLIKFNPSNGDDLVDICAGTGGFLLAGFHRIKELVQHENGTEKEITSLASKSLIGVEIDKDISEVGNSTLTSRLGSREKQHIYCANSLSKKQLEQTNKVQFGTHSCAATNPPFGAKIQVRDLDILIDFDLAKLKGSTTESISSVKEPLPRSPDILFIEQNIKLLRPGTGRLAIVMPYQLLSGPQATYIRHWILLNCSITAVIDLPSETFQPHTGTKTSLVALTRRDRPLLNIEDCSDEPIFMATPRWIGHDRRGNPTFERDVEGKQLNTVLTDFPLVEFAYEKYCIGNDFSEYEEAYTIQTGEVVRDKHLRLNAMFYKQRDQANFMSASCENLDDWGVVKLGSIVKKIFYPGRFKRNYVDKYPGAVAFLGGSNITEFITETGKWIRPDDPHIDQLRVSSGWILVTRSGSTGIVSTVPPAWDGFAMSEHVIRIIPDEVKMPGEYLYAYLKSKLGQLELSKGIFGSVIEEISPDSIGEINLMIPKDKNILNKIVHKIGDSQKARDEALTSDVAGIAILEKLIDSNAK